MRKNGLDPDRTVTLEKERLELKGQTLVFCGWGKRIKGILGFSEELREDAKEAILRLKEINIDTVMLTGDNRHSAKAVATILGIESKGELTPEDKVREIKKHKEVSVMVGDGINDVPALSAADIGIAIGCGTDIARESADINLLGERLEKIPWVIKLSRETRKRIKENLFWAFFYNTIGIVVAALGFLKPVVAALAMIVSSILVLGNSLRLQKERI
jgi:Cu+-exporting ATPase